MKNYKKDLIVSCKLNGEFNFKLPKHRADRPEWYTDSGWEKKRIQHLHEHLTKDDLLFYVGAEEGDIAGLCSQWVKDIVLFEPNEKVWPNIKLIWEANNLKTPLECFVGFASDKNHFPKSFVREVNTFPECADGSVIGDHGFKELKEPMNIPQIKIDDMGFVPTAIALDVEGSEWKVLKGAVKILKTHRPKIWLSLHPEFMLTQYNEWGAELRRWLLDFGYKETLLDYPLHEVHLFYE